MLFYLLFIPLVFCSDTTESKLDTTNKTSDLHKESVSNGNVPLLSEGGSLLPDTLLLALPKGNESVSSVNSDIGKNKVVARKGVNYTSTTSQEQSVPSSNDNSSMKPITSGEKPNPLHERLNNTSDLSVLKGKSNLLDKMSNVPKDVVKTETPKKPLVLYSEVLESMTVKSSPETIINQIKSPSKEMYQINQKTPPGTVMPIVITILIVPMFAVFGYMALRRGQEAWKNRHYKRTDFLLDGMYND